MEMAVKEKVYFLDAGEFRRNEGLDEILRWRTC